MKKIRVIVVDDSALIRDMFTEILNSDPFIEVIATANDPFDARTKIKELDPDVITLDIEMPKMDGISFLKKIMSLRPMPVVMVSSLTKKGAEITIRALEIGAVDFVPKTSTSSFDIHDLRNVLISKVKAAARAKIQPITHSITTQKGLTKALIVPNMKKNMLIAIGSSTGGVEAIKDVITHFPKNTPPVVITQHMPKQFTPTFAKRMNSICHVNVQEAKNRDKIQAGNIYIAPGDVHMEIVRVGRSLECLLNSNELVSGHRPSVDVMFESIAKSSRENTVGVILTGMGKDGASGMVSMKKAGSYNIGQDENTSVVYGMPKAAYMAGAVDKQLPIEQIALHILQQCK